MRHAKITFLLIYLLSGTTPSLAQEEKTLAEKEGEILDFNSIRDILKTDQLEKNAEKKKVTIQKVQKKRKDTNRRLFQVPGESEFWSFFTEYWLVKNAPVLNWDFSRPDYGLNTAFEELLEKLGFFEQRFKILMVNSPNITHLAMPTDPKKEVILLLSVPFLKALDLSKLEISLMLLEDYMRAREGLFKEMGYTDELKELIGGNFQGDSLNKKILAKLSQSFDKVIFDEGFNFQQQFQITKKMDGLLKSDLSLWNTYFKLIQKKETLVKENILFIKYSKIYPSPELQLSWLKPKTKAL
jgi:hypothetical protein